jgi:hypothetical protein
MIHRFIHLVRQSTALTFYSLFVTWCTNSLTSNNCTLCPHSIYVFCIIWEQTATCASYSINWLVFITEMKSVYCAVRTGSLNKAVCASTWKGYFVFVRLCQYLDLNTYTVCAGTRSIITLPVHFLNVRSTVFHSRCNLLSCFTWRHIKIRQ